VRIDLPGQRYQFNHVFIMSEELPHLQVSADFGCGINPGGNRLIYSLIGRPRERSPVLDFAAAQHYHNGGNTSGSPQNRTPS
jgi:hypothetical protein